MQPYHGTQSNKIPLAKDIKDPGNFLFWQLMDVYYK